MAEKDNVNLDGKITSTFTKGFSELNKYLKATLIAAVVVVGSIKLAGKEIAATFDSIYGSIIGRQTLEEKQQEFLSVTKYADSVKKVIQKQKTEKAFRGRFEIKQKCIELQKAMPGCLTVSLWSIHNGGAELKIDNNWELDVNESSDKEVESDFNDDQTAKEPIWDGLIYFGNKVKDEGITYIGDVSKDPLFNQGKLKIYFIQRGLKAVHSMYVGNDGKNIFFISFDYNRTYPDQALSEANLRYFKSYVKSRMEL